MSHLFVSGGHVLSRAGSLLTDGALALSIPTTLTNFSAFSATAQPVRFGQVFADGQIPAGSHIVMTNSVGGALPTQQSGERYYASGAVMACTVTFVPDGTIAPSGAPVFQLTAATGAPNRTGLTPAAITANAQHYFKLFGGDLAADLPLDTAGDGTIDWFELDFAYICANFVDSAVGSWGTNPLGGWTTESSGAVETTHSAWGYVRRHSDGAVHKYKKLKAYRTAFSATGPFDLRYSDMQPNTYGPVSGGTVPATLPGYLLTGQQPRVACCVEMHERLGSALIPIQGGGANDIRVAGGLGNLTSVNFDFANNRILLPTALGTPVAPNHGPFGNLPAACTGGITGGVGVMFIPTGGSTLPTGLLPAPQVYFPAVPHWGSSDPPLNAIYLVPERFWVGGNAGSPVALDQSGPGAWVSGGAVSGSNRMRRNLTTGAMYYSPGGGTSGNQAPVGTGTGISDQGTAGSGIHDWQSVNAQFTDAGSGTIQIIPVNPTFNNNEAMGFSPECRTFWHDPVGGSQRAFVTVGHDSDQLFVKSGCLPSFRKTNCTPYARKASWSSPYIPGATLVEMSNTWNFLEKPGSQSWECRYGGIGNPQLNAFYLFSDKLTWIQMMLHGLQLGDLQKCWHDETTGWPIINNLGPTRDGTTPYPGFPAGSLRPNNWLSAIGGGDVAAAAVMNRADPGWWHTYAQYVNSSHLSLPSFPCWLKTGDEIWRDKMLEQFCGQMGSIPPAGRNPVNPFGDGRNYSGVMTVAGSAAVGGQQTRGAAHTLRTGLYLDTILPSNHPMRPYVTDCYTETGLWCGALPAWMAANKPNTFALGVYMGDYSAAIGFQQSLLALFLSVGANRGDAHPGYATLIDNYLVNYLSWFEPASGGSPGNADYYTLIIDSTRPLSDATNSNASALVSSDANVAPSWAALTAQTNNGQGGPQNVGSDWGLWLNGGTFSPLAEGHVTPAQTDPNAVSFMHPFNTEYRGGISNNSGTYDGGGYVQFFTAACANVGNRASASPRWEAMFRLLDARRSNPLYFVGLTLSDPTSAICPGAFGLAGIRPKEDA